MYCCRWHPALPPATIAKRLWVLYMRYVGLDQVTNIVHAGDVSYLFVQQEAYCSDIPFKQQQPQHEGMLLAAVEDVTDDAS